ncbi:hypothetical protein [Streptomyces sp. NPDC002156]
MAVTRVDASLRPEEALARLGADSFALVTTAAREREPSPVSLLDLADLTALRDRGAPSLCAPGAAVCPCVLLRADMTLGELTAGMALTLLDLSPHGAVLWDPSGSTSVLPGKVVDDWLARTPFLPVDARGAFDESASDGLLGGDIRLPAAFVTCASPGCGHTNRLDFYDPQRPPVCARPGVPPHTLVLTGE